jgi:hypothetical protein
LSSRERRVRIDNPKLGAGSLKEIEWLLTACATEQAAKEVAAEALARGVRVAAGTVPGGEPRIRVGWRAAHHWAQSSNKGAIMSLRRRVFEFAA